MKDKDTIRQELIEKIEEYLPDLDVSAGSPERDLFVEAPLEGQLAEIWGNIEYNYKLSAPAVYYNDLSNEDVDSWAANYGVTRLPSRNASGVVIFFTYTDPNANIVIPLRSEVTTSGSNPLTFRTSSYAEIPFSTKESFYNMDSKRWEITVPVSALEGGPDYRAGTNTVTVIKEAIEGLSGVFNPSVISGGTDAESNEELVVRVLNTFKSRGLGNDAGLFNYVQGLTQETKVIRSGHPLMVRDEGLGGAVDIYIRGEDIQTIEESFTVTQVGLDAISGNYGEDYVILSNTPLRSVSFLSVNNTVYEPAHYSIVLDTGVLKYSSQAKDKVVLTAEGIAAHGLFEVGDVVNVGYLYNALPRSIENSLNIPSNKYTNRDYLIREFLFVYVDVYVKVKTVENVSFDDVKEDLELAIASYIELQGTGGSLYISNIVGILKGYNSVENVDLTTAEVTGDDPVMETPQGDFIIPESMYARHRTITIEEWVN